MKKSNKLIIVIGIAVVSIISIVLSLFIRTTGITKLLGSINTIDPTIVMDDDFAILNTIGTKDTLVKLLKNTKIKVISNGVEIDNNTAVKTNDILQIGNIEYTIVVKGDVYPDGVIDINDVNKLYSYVKRKTSVVLTDAELLAADFVENNIIEIQDVSKIYNAYESPYTPTPLPDLIEYTVTFNSNGGSAVESQSVVEGNTAVEPKDPKKDGYSFDKWLLNGQEYDFNSPVNGPITLDASWVQVDNSVEAYFLNTQIKIEETETQDSDMFYSNQAIIFKTRNNKVIMVDTANNNSEIQNIIYNKLKEISGSNNVTIDYLLISHSHGDHYGNLEYLLTNPNITVENVIYKKEKLNNVVEQKLSNFPEVNKIETTSLNETMHQITIDNVKMLLFNLNDVYASRTESACNKPIYVVKYSSSKRKTSLKHNNMYIYLNSLNPEDNILRYSDTIDRVQGDLGLENGYPVRRYYAYATKKETLCNANSNSIALLLEVSTSTSGKRYIYVPSDLSNNGYPFHGQFNQTALDNGFRYGTIYSDGVYHLYENTYDETKNNVNNSWTIEDDKFVSTNKNIKAASESRVANQIRNYLGDSNLNKIKIYQRSHHGYSDAKDAIDTLELNRSGVYSIATTRSNGNNYPDALLARGYYYTLSNTTKLATGGSGDGVYCYIRDNNTYKCKRVSN